MRQKTKDMLDFAYSLLSEIKPMTVRQVYYQLVAALIIDNKPTEYQAVSKMLVAARKDGTIPWEWLEDRTRRPHEVNMWGGIAAFAETAKNAYRRDVWYTQPQYVECWVEKDALSGIFLRVLNPYGVTLNVGRGYDGWDSIHNAAERFGDGLGVTVLYFGDFDPSGEDMFRCLCDRLAELGCTPELIKCALTMQDIERYNLPPALAKKTDTRAKKFIDAHGDVSVELDALPVNVLRERIRQEVESRMDMGALNAIREAENSDKSKLADALAKIA